MTVELPPTIGRYEVVELAGKGATGVVYKARDPVIGRTLAIKMIASLATLPPRERMEFRERFVREAQFAGNLHHQNIATLYDIGEEDGLPFMALEFVEGESLTRRLARTGPLPPAEAVRIVRQVADGLAHAHARGVVHRDIKTDNILLDPEGRAVITDFGIARISSNDPLRVADVQGTPHFMSPEQVLGRNLDGRSDLFSLGVVLYALLTGKRPFIGENLGAVCQQIVYAPPQPSPPGRPVPPRLAAIIDRLLQKEPDRRFASARELIAALDALRVPVPSSAPPAPAEPKRSSPLTARMAALLGVLLLLAAVALFLSRP